MKRFSILRQRAASETASAFTRRAAAGAVAVVASLALSAQAQTDSAPAGDPSQTTSPYSAQGTTAAQKDFSDTQLKSYLEAREGVDAQRNKINQQLQQETDPEKSMEMRAAAQQKMLAVVEEAGLSGEEYNEIARAVAMDPALAARVDKLR